MKNELRKCRAFTEVLIKVSVSGANSDMGALKAVPVVPGHHWTDLAHTPRCPSWSIIFASLLSCRYSKRYPPLLLLLLLAPRRLSPPLLRLLYPPPPRSPPSHLPPPSLPPYLPLLLLLLLLLPPLLLLPRAPLFLRLRVLPLLLLLLLHCVK